MKQLFGFQRVELDPKQNATLFFDAGVEVFKTVDEEVTKLSFTIIAGTYL